MNTNITQNSAYIFFGRSGSGKGTQAKLLLQELEARGKKVITVETGKELRAFVEQSPDLLSARMTHATMERGEFMPVFIPIWVWVNRLVRDFTGSESLLMDGVCRRLDEAPILASALDYYGYHTVAIIHIDVSRAWSTERLLARGRSDDHITEINRRMDAYDAEVPPVLEYMQQISNYHFVSINGEQSIEEVHQEIMNKLSANQIV